MSITESDPIMQRSTLFRFTRGGSAVGLAALLFSNVQGAELGELTVRSFVGQPLVADIELTALAPDEITDLQVRLASPDVYRGANISMNPALASLHLALMRHDDQRQFLHLTSLQAVDAPYIHLFLSLNAGGRHAVRAATLWLAPDPRPAPALPFAASAPPLAAAVPVLLAASAPMVHVPPVALAPDVAVFRSSPTVAASHPHFAPERACPQQSDAPVQACAELDSKNAALSAKIVDLEEKVKVLQVALVPQGEPLAAMPRKAGVPAPKLKAAQSADMTSMLALIAGAVMVLLLMGTGGYLFLRRKQGKVTFEVSKYWVLLRSSFKRAPALAEPAEPAE